MGWKPPEPNALGSPGSSGQSPAAGGRYPAEKCGRMLRSNPGGTAEAMLSSLFGTEAYFFSEK